MASIISQVSVFDYSGIEILGDLERLQLAFAGIDDESLLSKLEKKRGIGRDDYPIRVMWNLVIAMKVFEHKSVASFRRELSRNAQLRKICGLNDFDFKKHLIPPARVFSGFFKLLASEQEEVDFIFDTQVSELYDKVEGFGENLAGDGKYLDSFCKHKPKEEQTDTDNRTENDAEYSKKEYKYTGTDGKEHTKTELHYGFKAHIICDVKTELPISYLVTKGNHDEKKALATLLGNFSLKQKKAARALLLDRGYDATELIRLIKSMHIHPVVDIRNMWKDKEETKQYKDTDIVYDAKGGVYFVELDDNGEPVNVKMDYKGYDKQKKCLRYAHKGKIYKIYISYDERIFLPIARDSEKFKRLYKGRTAVERLNGRLDRDYMFEDHTIRGLKKMNLMVSLSMIVMNGMALGKINRELKNCKPGEKVKGNLEGLRSLKRAA